MTVKQRLEAGLLQLGLVCQVEPLLQYVDLLVKWNHVYNLTAVKTPEEMITRHLLDSLAIAPYLRGGGKLPMWVLGQVYPAFLWR